MLTTLSSLLAVAFTLGAGDLGSKLDDPVLAVLAEEEAMDFDLFGDTEAMPREAIDPSEGARPRRAARCSRPTRSSASPP